MGIYALGKAANNGYARFTTSPAGIATWAAGTAAPIGACAQGSLYTLHGRNTRREQLRLGLNHYALWGCPVSPGGTWVGIK